MKHGKTKSAGKPRKARKFAPTSKRRVAKVDGRDPRIPAVGSILKRTFKGRDIKVQVMEDGFRYDGETYRSLTAVALKVTGYPATSGTAFFGLWRAPGKRR